VGEGVSEPSVPASVWVWAAFDPILIGIAAYLGFKADQFGKIFIAAIAALGLSVLLAWLLTIAGIPWVAPVRRDLPTLFPVRAIAALAWAAIGFCAAKVIRR
jgi:membrane-bound metal-dependent hydrolase YbcI (DUF457 family)